MTKYLKDFPVFPAFEPLDLEHKHSIEERLKVKPLSASEMNFAEMFMWRKVRNTSVSVLDSNIIIRLQKNDGFYLYPPLGGNNEKKCVEEMLRADIGSVYGYSKEEAEDAGLGAFKIEEDRDNYDYVYSANSLISLEGRKYDGKRNHIKKFPSEKSSLEPILPDMLPAIIEFQEKWCRNRNCDDDLSLTNEGLAVMELLNNYADLPVFGAAMYVENEIKGYSVASSLSDDTAVVIIEKADPSVKGIYQAINQAFAAKFLNRFIYINREQDGGYEGLRKAKLSYEPELFIEKVKVSLK